MGRIKKKAVVKRSNLKRKTQKKVKVCYWDCEEIKNEKPLKVVLNCRNKTKETTKQGHFCSGNCQKAFLIDLRSPHFNNQIIWTREYLKQKQEKHPEYTQVVKKGNWLKGLGIKSAPSRFTTQKFDPKALPIEEWREKYCPDRMLPNEG